MRSYNRLRFLSGVLSLLALGLLLTSWQYHYYYAGRKLTVGCGGAFFFMRTTALPTQLQGGHMERSPLHQEWMWWPTVLTGASGAWILAIPLWIPAATAGLAYMLLGRARPIRAGLCRKCDYDLTGNISGVCPECGRKIEERMAKIESNPS